MDGAMDEAERLGLAYMGAKEFIIDAGFGGEVDWQSEVRFDWVTEADFLRETAWVVLATGFREENVRQRFGAVSEAFFGWCDARRICRCRENCQERALAGFGNRRKIEAIGEIACRVAARGIEYIKDEVRSRGVEYLQELPYLGPVTSWHLAKNIGLDAVKPDRHLVRMADSAGCRSPAEMCSKVAAVVGDSVGVVDVVLWRYATLSGDYEVLARSRLGAGGKACGRRSGGGVEMRGR